MSPLPVSRQANQWTPGLVSIVTPTLNAEKFIDATIRSVRAQTHKHVEHIIVDGGSTDSTLRIAKRYEDSLRVIQAPGFNQAAAVNLGFRASRGEFFGFLNADDTLTPSALESGVAALRAEPGAALAYAQANHIDSDGTILGPYPVGTANLETLSRECVICQPATLMRSEAFGEIGGLQESLNFAMDYDLWLRLTARKRRFIRVHELWAESRMHKANKTLGQRAGVYKEAFRVLRSHFGYVPFSWIHAYAGYLLDGRDHFFEPPAGSPMRSAWTLMLGLRQNSAKPLRFLAEYTAEMIRLHTKR